MTTSSSATRVFSGALFTISILIAILGINTVVVIGVDVQVESNLCYALRLNKDCSALTDQTTCNTSDKQCFWIAESTGDKCQSPWADGYRTASTAEHRIWATEGMQACSLGFTESSCTNLLDGNACEWDATSSYCKIKKTGMIADLIYDKFSLNYHRDAATKCWPIATETDCNADCTWTTAPDGVTYCELTKTIPDLYDDYCNATTTWFESLVADSGVCKLVGKEETCETIGTATDCGNESGCSWSDDDECDLNTEFDGKLQALLHSGLLSGVKKHTKCAKLGFDGETVCKADSDCEWLGLGGVNNCGATLDAWKTIGKTNSNFGGSHLYALTTCNRYETENACNANVICTWECDHDDHDDHDDHHGHAHRLRHALRIRRDDDDDDECSCNGKESLADPGLCPAEYFPTQSVPSAGVASATGAVTLTGYTAAQFGDDQRQAFVRGIATFLNVPVPLVSVTHVHDVSSRRRRKLKSSSIEVDYSVSGSVDEVQGVVAALNGEGAESNIGAALEFAFEARGFTAPSVTAITTASVILPSPPPSPPPPSSAYALEKGTLCIVAIVSAFLLF